MGVAPAFARPIGYVAADLPGLTADEIIRLLVELEYQAVDWTMGQFDPVEEPSEVFAGLVRRSHDAGLLTPQLMVHQDYVTLDAAVWDERVRRTELAVDACAQAGVRSIGVLTGPNRWEPGFATVGSELSEAEAWKLALSALERVLHRAEQAGVLVALEPCWGTLARDRYRAEYLFSQLDSAALAVNFDPSHFVLTGDDIPAAVAAWGPRIAHVHLKDAVGTQGLPDEEFTFLLPGEGRVPWAAMFGALDAVEYTGAICVENEAFTLLQGALNGDLRRWAALAREFAGGVATLGRD